MPTIRMFYGILVSMYALDIAKHHAPHMRQWLHQRGQARAQCRSSGGAGAGRDGWDGRAEPGIAGAVVSGDGAMRRVPLTHCNTERPCMADLRAY